MNAAEILQLVQARASAIVDGETWRWMQSAAAHFTTPTDIGIEFPLSGEERFADLFIAYRPLKAELERALSGALDTELPECDELWFELDHDAGARQAASVFVGSPRSLEFDAARASRWLSTSEAGATAAAQLAEHVADYDGWVSHLGVMQRRVAEGLRANVRFSRFSGALQYLSACEVDSPELLKRAQRSRALEQLAEVVVCHPVPQSGDALPDLSEQRWSLELFPRHSGGVEPLLEPLLIWLSEEELIDGERAVFCFEWPDDTTPMDAETWPRRYVEESLLDELPRLTSFAARFSHVKLSFEGERFRKARGYVAFSHVWR